MKLQELVLIGGLGAYSAVGVFSYIAGTFAVDPEKLVFRGKINGTMVAYYQSAANTSPYKLEVYSEERLERRIIDFNGDGFIGTGSDSYTVFAEDGTATTYRTLHMETENGIYLRGFSRGSVIKSKSEEATKLYRSIVAMIGDKRAIKVNP